MWLSFVSNGNLFSLLIMAAEYTNGELTSMLLVHVYCQGTSASVLENTVIHFQIVAYTKPSNLCRR